MEENMTRILADADLTARLKTLKGPARVVDEAGHTLGVFQPEGLALPGVAATLSPHTDEELRELRKQRDGGLPLSEVLKRIGAQ
jgi:hypothetical protein